MVKQFEKVEVVNFDTDEFIEEELRVCECCSSDNPWDCFYFKDLSKKGQIDFIDSLIESLQKYKAQI